MEFRSACAADVDAIVALWAPNDLGSGPAVDAAEIVERLREDDGFFVIGEIGGEPVAVAMGCYDNHRGWLKRVAVHPSQQGTGLGRQLVEEVERRFLAAGVSKLRLAVWHDNRAALGFWSELGYEELPDIHYFAKDLLGNADDGC